MRAKDVEITLPYKFTPVELLQLGKQLAEQRFTIEAIELRKKASMEAFKGELEIAESELYRLARIVRRGAEDRVTPCQVSYNDPHTGEKSFYRKDTGELVKTVAMTDAERQEDLQLKDTVIDESESQVN